MVTLRRPHWSRATLVAHVKARPALRRSILGALTALILVPGLYASGQLRANDGAVLTVRARGATGQERFAVKEAGTVLATFTASRGWKDYTVTTPSAAGAPDVEVAFLNDGPADGPGHRDRNLLVDFVRYAGRTYASTADTVLGTGVWEHGGSCQPGYWRSRELACNGSLGFGTLAGPAPAAQGQATATIEFDAGGSTGNELLELRVAGRPVTVFRVAGATDLWSGTGLAHYRYQYPGSVKPDQIALAFVNDRFEPGVDYNIRLRSARLDGHRITTTGANLAGSSARMPLCRPQELAAEILACNGWFSFGAGVDSDGTDDTTTVASPSTVTTTGPTTTTTAAATTTASTARAKPTTTTANPGPAGRFYVVGSDIVGPDGNLFLPIGANAAVKFTGYNYVFEGGNGGVNDHLADVQAWNWNTIRVNLICDNESGVPSFNELVNGIAPTIDAFTKAKVVMILECHDSTGKNPVLGSAKERRIRRFWDEMVTRYKANPYVWFNPFNEPYNNDDIKPWTDLHQFYVDRIRAAGAENPVIVDLPNWSQGLDLLADGRADTIRPACNVLFGWHAYGALHGHQATLAETEDAIKAVQARKRAVIAGELGVATPQEWGNAGPWQWNLTGYDAVTQLGPRYGIGLLWWNATGDDANFSLYALKNDRTGFWTANNSGNLTPYGSKFWTLSHQLDANRGPFTGRLADSGCASAQ